MAHKRFKCACGMTTTRTENDAKKFVNKKVQTTKNYNPLGKKKK